MCGIAGSTNKEQAFKLYKSNLNRGYYSSGFTSIKNSSNKDSQAIIKTLGVWEQPQDVSDSVYYLYHSRGPTTETNEFVPDNNHPFVYKNWVVAHNGIISNFKDLGKKYFPEEDFTGKTDSCIIPRLLSIRPMKDVLEELKGTFALWIWSPYSYGVYLCRSGSTLFANFDTGDFCSTEFEGSTNLSEGIIYKIDNYKSIHKFGQFKSNSPYFVL